MYPSETVAAVLELGSIGMTTAWISRELRVPQASVRRWLRDRRGRRPESPWPVPSATYAYLLGLYLGDGHISRGAGGQHVMTIACDGAYPAIIASTRAAMAALSGGRSVWLKEHPVHRCTRVVCSSRWWPILFPQHGPGRKHSRRIVLAGWQQTITRAHPRDLVRGLIHSDGCRFVANQRVGDRRYRYVRYAFKNRSADIIAILCVHLHLLGIGWARPNARTIAIDRRSEVAKLDAFVGPKR
jgi:hypothetical protein